VSYSNALSKDNALPVWVPFARGKGSLAGPVTFREVPEVSDVDGQELLWFKPATPGADAFPDGWPGGVPIDLIGSRFTPPPHGSGRSIFPGLDPADAQGNALVKIADESAARPLMTIPISIDPKNQVLVIQPGDDRFQASITPSIGWFRGSFIAEGSGKLVRFNGAVLQKQQRASGYFTTARTSGSISIQPKASAAPE
jgi:hypothetical protein